MCPRKSLFSSAELEQVAQGLNALFKEAGVVCAYLFGSYARHEARMTSDVDIAVWMEPVTAERYRQLWCGVYQALGTEHFDLLLSHAPPVLAFQIISAGRLIFGFDDEQLNQVEHHVLRNYRDTHHLRRRQNKLLREKIAEWSSSEKALLRD